MTVTPAIERPVPRVPIPPANLVWCEDRLTWTLPRATPAPTPTTHRSAFIAGLTDRSTTS